MSASKQKLNTSKIKYLVQFSVRGLKMKKKMRNTPQTPI